MRLLARIVLLAIALLVVALPVLAQFNFPALTIHNGTADPANCQPHSRNVFINRASTPVLKICSTADTWVDLMTSAGGTFTGPIVLSGSTSGTLTLKAPAVAGTNTLTLPAGTTDFSATGCTACVVQQASAGSALTVAQVSQTATDLGVGAAATAGHGFKVTAPSSETTLSADNIKFGVVSGTPRMMLEDNGSTLWQVDNNAGALRFITPGNVRFSFNGTTGAATFQGDVAAPTFNSLTITGKPATSVVLTTQAASIGATNLYAAAAAGLYRVCFSEIISQAATTSSSILVTIGWNNGGAKTSTLASLNGGALQTTADTSNTVNSELSNCIAFRSAAAQNITYATTYASSGATPMQYALMVSVEKVQ